MLPKWCAEPSPPAAGQRREPPAVRERAGSPGRAGAAVGGGAAAVSPRSPRVNRASSSGSGSESPRHQFVAASLLGASCAGACVIKGPLFSCLFYFIFFCRAVLIAIGCVCKVVAEEHGFPVGYFPERCDISPASISATAGAS